MKVKNLYVEEITDIFEEISKIQVGSDEYEKGTNLVSKLTDRLIRMDELEIEKCKLDLEQEKIELEKQKAKDEKLDKLIKNGTVIVTAVGGMIITVVFGRYAYRFEEHGVITTKPGHKFVDKAIDYFFKH